MISIEHIEEIIEKTIKELEFVGMSLSLLNLFEIVIMKNGYDMTFRDYKGMLEYFGKFEFKKENGIINVKILKKG